MPLIEAGEDKIKADGGYGLRQLWELLFGLTKDSMFSDPGPKQWFEDNVVKDGRLIDGADNQKIFDIKVIGDKLHAFFLNHVKK